MRLILRLLFAVGLVTLAAGPLLAAPALLSSGPTLTAALAPAASAYAAVAVIVLLTVGVAGITIKKDIGSIAQKFVTRAQAAAGDYKTGVQQAGGKWESNTGAAESNYEQGVQASIARKGFSSGVQGKGGKYQTNAVNLGSARYGPGVANAQSAYQAGMQPVLNTLQSIQLPPKSFRGSPSNMARANAVATALAAMRTATK